MTSDSNAPKSNNEVSSDQSPPEQERSGAGMAPPVDGPSAAEAGGTGELGTEESAEDKLRADAARLKDQLLRLAADFDNFRKRSRREISDAERMAREDLLRELLPVFDNLERASQHAGAATDVQSLIDGINMVSRQFLDTLARVGVQRVETVGCAFDPAVHEAVQQLETADQPPGSVCAEVLAGYKFGERLIRPAMVVVAKPVSSS